MKESIEVSFEKPKAVICFDDGFHSIVTNAKPILDEHNIPYVIFLNPSFLDQNYFSEPLLSHLIEKTIDHEVIQKTFGNKTMHGGLWNHIRINSSIKQIKLLQELITISDFPKYYLSWNDLESLNDDRVTLANHTSHHLFLSSLSIEEQKSQIMLGHQRLKKLDNYYKILAIPFGSNNSFNSDTLTFIPDYSQNILIKANGGIDHTLQDSLVIIERIGLSNNKPSISQHIHNRLYGTPFFEKILDKLKSMKALS
ncbi:MAG: polysaccharide deacetylase family protein [Gammaproteobacteria bacterium]|mgnify:FL=1|nr:polysaccharide deacetylase family protein [Gammaproteobacteria bacterium]